MRSMIRPFLVGLPLLWMQGATMAQNQCADHHKFNCERSTDSRFSLNGQSASAAVKVGQETELNIIVYRGQDYRISLCHDEKTLGEQLAIRLVEKVREPIDVVEEVSTTEPILGEDGKPTGATQEVKTKRTKKVFEEVEKVLWDNTANNMAQEVEFSCAATKRIAVEVNAPGGAETKGKKEQFDIGCVGILIEHMPTPGLGFEPGER
jgi:hypothetical protein